MLRKTGGTSDDYLPPVFNCPEADLVRTHKLSYAMNVIVGVVPENELDFAPPPRAVVFRPPPPRPAPPVPPPDDGLAMGSTPLS